MYLYGFRKGKFFFMFSFGFSLVFFGGKEPGGYMEIDGGT